MLHVTVVPWPSGLKVNSAVASPAIGLKNSSFTRTSSFGLLSMIVWRPAPTSLLPSQALTAPTPLAGPSKVYFAAGSSFTHGDQTWDLWRSLTWANTSAAG